MNVSRRKNEVSVSLAYRLVFFVPSCGFGDASMGITAGRGSVGAGEAERRDENEDLRLWLITLGGFMGSGMDVGVPGAEGTGDPTDVADSIMDS